MTNKSLLLVLFIFLAQNANADFIKKHMEYDNSSEKSISFLDGTVTSTLTFSMDSCSAWVLAGTRNEYTEFTAPTNIDSSCAELSVLNGHLYREDPHVNFHSCTPGINNTTAICISSDNACTFDKGNQKSLKIDLIVDPGVNGSASLSNISFYERAPESFIFLDGPTGPNNYPTLFGIRILKNGQEVYFAEDIPTNLDWTLQSIDLGNNPELIVTSSTVFNIELMAYCLIDNGEGVTAWDLDEIVISSVCSDESIDGGILTTIDGLTELDICSLDGVSDAFEVSIINYSGTNSDWLVTDNDGFIIAIPDNPPFDFEGSALEVCKVYHLASEGPISGVDIGNHINNITGCYGLSNAIIVNKISPVPGIITLDNGATSFSLCVGGIIGDSINVNLTGGNGANSQWLITDLQGNILDTPASPPFDISNAGVGTCLIRHISYDGSISGVEIGNNVSDITGCFSFSNSITVYRETLEGGTISLISLAVDTTICISDSQSDSLDVLVNSQMGQHSAWIITDEDLNIIDLPLGPPFDLEASNPNTCLIWFVTFENIDGLNIGSNTANLSGCFGLSNSITVHRETSNGGFISYDGEVYIEICEDDGVSNQIDLNHINQVGQNTIWVITDENGLIIETSVSASFNFDSRPSGTYIIYNVMYNSSLIGLDIGSEIGNVSGTCISLSNSVTVVKETAIGGIISSPDGIDIRLRITDGDVIPIEVDLTGNQGDFSTWLILDADGNILEIPVGPPFTPSFSNDECFIRHLSYGASFAGLAVDQNISGFLGCYDLSNEIRIEKDSISGGYLSSGGETFVFFCSLAGAQQAMINYELINNVGDDEELFLTDEDGKILEMITGSVIDLSNYPSGEYFVYNLAYNSLVFNNHIGNFVDDISGDCIDLSNPLSILKKAIDGGVLGSSLGTNIELCRGGSSANFEEVDISVTNTIGTHTSLLVTDEDGYILSIPLDIPLNLDTVGVNPCFVWHVSYEVGLTGKEVGNHISDLVGCFDFSNFIKIYKTTVEGGELSSNGETSFDFCVGDGIPDIVDVQINGSLGPNSTYLVTDENNQILDVSNQTSFDFESAGSGTCLIYHLSYLDPMSGMSEGENLDTLNGCFDLSNSITIVKNEISVRSISFNDGSLEKRLCVGDGSSDFVSIVNVSSGLGSSSLIVTDEDGNILDLPNSNTINFENAGPGNCYIWQINYNGHIDGLEEGQNFNDLSGCYLISNSVKVVREEIIASTISLAGGSVETNICVGTGLIHVINVFETSQGNGSSNWIITDASGIILDLPSHPPFDFSTAGEGVCSIWKVNYLGSIEGLEIGNDISDLDGCYLLSNEIRIIREEVERPSITYLNGTNEKTICLNDGTDDIVDFLVNGVEGMGAWLVTDDNGIILSLPNTAPIDFSSTGFGKCFIWYINFYGDVEGLEVGESAFDLSGCYKISNGLVLNRVAFDSVSSSSNLCVTMNDCNAIIISGDNQDYSEFTADINNSSECTQFTVVGGHLYRNEPQVNLHSCTPGVNNTEAMCINALDGCDFVADSDRAVRFDILVEPGSNHVANIGSLSFYERAPREFIWINGSSGPNNYPIKYGMRVLKNGMEIYREEDIPTSLEYSLETFDFSTNEDFVVYEPTIFSFELLSYCLVGSNGLVEIWDLDDIKLSSDCNSALIGGILTSVAGLDYDEVCTDDGIDDNLSVNLLGGQGPDMAWIVTDESGLILDLPNGPTFNFEGSGAGICLLRSISYVNGLTGLEIGGNISNLEGCFELSNALTVQRKTGEDCSDCDVEGGQLTFSDGSVEYTICADDGMSNLIEFNLSGNSAQNSGWLITNEFGFITHVFDVTPFEFEGFDNGTYDVWHVSYDDTIQNYSVGNLASSLVGCYDLSNSISVHAETIHGGGCGTFQIPDTDNFMMSPNPTSDILNIQTDIEMDNSSYLMIYNRLGQQLIKQDMGNLLTKVT